MAAANPAATVIDYALQLAAGAAAALAMSFGTSPTAAAASGFYGDQTASAEKICTQVGGQIGPYYQRNASTVDAYFPGAVTITGNLTVNGSTTTIHSTTIDVDDRVIRVNKSTGANDPAPTNICGISVYRGAIASVVRDHYGLFWDESATKWKLAVNTGGDDATLGAYLSLQALAITGTTITASTAFVGGTVAGTTASFSGQIASTLAIGTAPFAVTSTTKVTNLYADRAALADTVTTNANLTGVITSSGNATSIASQTGTGTKFVVDNGPTLIAPVLGAATYTTLSGGNVTDSALTSGRVTVASTAGLLSDSANLLYAAGVLTLGDGTGAKTFIISGAAGQSRAIKLQTAGGDRWQIRAATTAEAGADAGSPLVVAAYDDAGTNIDNPIVIVRAAAGAISLARQLQALNGTVGTPGVVFAGSTTTGFYRSAANAIGISISGADAGRWNAAGNLLIGTSTDGMTASGSLAIAQDLAHRGTALGLYNTTPIAKKTGYGTPTGNAYQASFAAGSITLPNLAAAVAQLIIDLKAYGLIGA